MSEIPNVSRKYSEEDYNVVIWQQGSNDGALEYRDLKGKELQNACANGREQDVLRLQAEGADANTKNQSGHTCLITAAINGHAHVLAALLVRNSNSFCCARPTSALRLAVYQTHFAFLIENDMNPTALIQAYHTIEFIRFDEYLS